jgi:hypothetical protein
MVVNISCAVRGAQLLARVGAAVLPFGKCES